MTVDIKLENQIHTTFIKIFVLRLHVSAMAAWAEEKAKISKELSQKM